MAKFPLALLLLGLLLGTEAESSSAQQVAVISGEVLDPVGAIIPNASVAIRNDENGKSYQVAADWQGKFTVSGLDAGNYDIKVRSPGFETFSRSKLHLDQGSRVVLEIQLDLCRMHHLGQDVPNFSTVLERRARSDVERELIAQADALPCPQDTGSRNARRPNCANRDAIRYYFDLVKQNQKGRLPEAGEGPVEAKAYYGASVEFDQVSKRWTAKLTIEYVVCCGNLCGEGVKHTRYVFFDQQKSVIRVEDDPDGECHWVS